MNILDPTLNAARANATNMTAMTNDTLPFLLSNQTQLLASVISASGGVNYSYGLFFGIAAALVAGSFVLPIITGPILRLTLQSIAEYRVYWRLVYPIAVAVYVVGAYILFPIFAVPASLAFQLLLPTIVFFSIFQGRGPFRWWKSRRGRRDIRSIVKRILFVVISVCCSILSVPNYESVAVGLLPLLILFWVWAGSSVKRWWARKGHSLWHRRS